MSDDPLSDLDTYSLMIQGLVHLLGVDGSCLVNSRSSAVEESSQNSNGDVLLLF